MEWEKEKFAVGYKCVTVNDNFFTGHFPDRPIMPGACGHAFMRCEHPSFSAAGGPDTSYRACNRMRMKRCDYVPHWWTDPCQARGIFPACTPSPQGRRSMGT